MSQNRLEPALNSPAGYSQPPQGKPPGPKIFASDRATGPDFLGTEAATAGMAELIAHGATDTPLTIGVFGAPGSGKSHALSRLMSLVESIAIRARTMANSPFLATIATVRLSAPQVIEHPTSAIATAVYERLSTGAAGPAAADIARDAIHASSDPQAAARDAAERLDSARRRLEAERRALTDLDGRRARLIDAVLYESGGSRVDGYARSNRTRIESRLRAFGFSGEPVQTYKDLVRDYAERGGLMGRVSTFLRSLWAFEGQTSLIVWAILFFLIAWGLGFAAESSPSWIPALRNSAEAMVPVANWIGNHLNWLSTLRTGAIAVAILCLVANLWRAFRFLSPIMRGAKLLRLDIDANRGDLDSQLAHQTRRVDMLAAEVESEGKRLADAEARARNSNSSAQPAGRETSFLSDPQQDRESLAHKFLVTLGQSFSNSAGREMRLVVALDDLEQVPPLAAANLLETAQRVLSSPNFILVVCANAGHLAAAWGSASTTANQFERLIQIPLSIDAGTSQENLSAYARALLNTDGSSSEFAFDPSHSSLDDPLSTAETDLLATLAPIAGSSPRSIKRFINIYRLARTRTTERAALALMLALDLGGTSGELAALGAAMDEHAPESEILVHPGEPRLTAALKAISVAQDRNLTVSTAQIAWHIARDYRIPL